MAHSAPHSLAPAQGFVLPALSQRAVLLAGIVAMHVVLVYVFASGLAPTAMHIVVDPLVATIIKAPPVKPPRQIPQTTQFIQPKVDPLPPPLIQINDPPEGPGAISIPVAPTPPVVTQPQPRVEPIHLVGRHQLPNTQDYYPPSLIREGIQGAAVARVCVDERGRIQSAPSVTESSGNARLDQAALNVLRDGKYARAARGETFVPNCYAFRIIFEVK